MRIEIAAFILTATVAHAGTVTPDFATVPVPPHVYDGGWEHFVGGGVAVFDCNGDALPDAYVAGGSNPAQLFVNTSSQTLSFHAQTPPALALDHVTGAYPIDIDSDGMMDLAILRVGPDILIRGQPDCAFVPFEGIGFQSGDHWTTGFSATWEKGQTLPTLAFGTYVDRTAPDGPFEACDATLLYRPNGGTYGAPRHLRPGYCALSLLFSDWARTGRSDLRVSNDRHYYVRDGQEQLWAMEPDPRLYTAEEGWQPYAIWGMGIASRDLTGDGFPEVYLTSMGDQKFQVFDPVSGGPTWRDATYERGTTAHRPHTGTDGRPSTGWHAQFGDVNNDGRDDIFVAKGNVEQMPDAAMDDPNTLLVQGPDGRFTETARVAGVGSMAKSRGGALTDLNNDGRLDLIVVNRGAPMEVFQNQTTGGNWTLVAVTQDRHNRQAAGAFIELSSPTGQHVREITIGGGHASGIAGYHHFGLAGSDPVRVRVIWPDGMASDWIESEANRIIEIHR